MRAANLQALTDDIKRRWPGVVIYGIGDAAHQDGVSDHNEDDMPARNAAQSDADTRPEHRAIDVMLGPNFSRADAYALVNALVRDPASQRRLYYIIWDGHIWSRSWNWTQRVHSGDPHRDHPHISGWAADDENAAGWPAVAGTAQEEDMAALEENVVIGTDIANLSNNYVRAGQKIPLGRFIQLIFSHNERDFQTGLAVRNVLTGLAAQVATISSGIAELKELLAQAGGNPDIALIIQKLEEEANKTRAFAQELMDKDEQQEREHAEKMAAAWQASVVE